MIGYKKVGDCTYPTLTGHTLRRKNIKLIQFVKAIKSNIVNERKFSNRTIDRNADNEFPSNNSDSSSVDVFADEGSRRVEMESSLSSSKLNDQKNKEEKNVIRKMESEVKEESYEEEDKRYVETYKHCGQISKPSEIENITHSASEEFNCVLDVD